LQPKRDLTICLILVLLVSAGWAVYLVTNTAVAIYSFFLTAAAVGACSSAYSMKKRLRVLLNEVLEIRHGRRAEPVDVECFDEIGELARQFNYICNAVNGETQKVYQAKSRIKTEVWSQTKELHIKLKRARKDAGTDLLSGLSNKGELMRRSQEFLDRAGLANEDLACLMIDVDNFKGVNDKFGHATGDNVIAFIGELLRGSARTDDFCGRYGGDEFVMLLMGCSAKQAGVVAERIRRHFAREVSAYMHCENTEPTANKGDHEGSMPGLSVGIASLKTDNPSDIKELIKMADNALYKSKGSGKNCVTMH